MEEDKKEINLPEWVFILLILTIVGGLTLAFYAGFNTYILAGVFILSVIALILIRAGILKIDIKITKEGDEEDDE